jgi:hypothetical protein
MKYKLTREFDRLVKESFDIKWIEWTELGRFKEGFDEPALGRSLVLAPFTAAFTWQTTEVIEILEKSESIIRFKTKNSIYTLEINN